jgi:hypothetical protein
MARTRSSIFFPKADRLAATIGEAAVHAARLGASDEFGHAPMADIHVSGDCISDKRGWKFGDSSLMSLVAEQCSAGKLSIFRLRVFDARN